MTAVIVQAAPKNQCVVRLSQFISQYSDGYMDGIHPRLVSKIDILKLTKTEIVELLGQAESTREILENKAELEFAISEALIKNEKSLNDLNKLAEELTKKMQRIKNQKKLKELEKEMSEIVWTMNQVNFNTRYLYDLEKYVNSLEQGPTLN